MYILIFFMLICLSAYMAVNKKNMFSYAIVMYFIGIFIMHISSSIYLSRFYAYDSMNQLDYYIQSRFLQINISISATIVIFNIGVVLIMISCLSSANACGYKKWYQNVLMFIPAIIYMLLEKKDVGLYVYLRQNIHGEGMIAYKIVTSCLFLFYIAVQLAELMKSCVNTKLVSKKKNDLAVLVSMIMVDVYVITVFFIGNSRRLMFKNADFTTIEPAYIGDYMLLIILILVMVAVMMLTIYFQPSKQFSITFKKHKEQEQNMFDDNLSMVMHIYKNAFLGIKKYVELNELSTNVNYIKNNDEEIYKICNKTLENMQNTLSHLEKRGKQKEIISLEDAVGESVKKSYVDSEIKVLNKVSLPVMVLANKDKLVEVIVNLINNAVDAIKKEEKEGLIEIETGAEGNYAYILVDDNVGILKKEDIKYIFKLFYTTKPRNKNSGIGLYYSRKIIEQYGGDISVKVIPGIKTSFQIILPRLKE